VRLLFDTIGLGCKHCNRDFKPADRVGKLDGWRGDESWHHAPVEPVGKAAEGSRTPKRCARHDTNEMSPRVLERSSSRELWPDSAWPATPHAAKGDAAAGSGQNLDILGFWLENHQKPHFLSKKWDFNDNSARLLTNTRRLLTNTRRLFTNTRRLLTNKQRL